MKYSKKDEYKVGMRKMEQHQVLDPKIDGLP